MNPAALNRNRGRASVVASRCKSSSLLTKRPGALTRRIWVHSRVRSEQPPRNSKVLPPLFCLRQNLVQQPHLRAEDLHRKLEFRILERQPQTHSLQSTLHAKLHRRSAISKIQPILFRRGPFTLSFQKKSVLRPLNQYPHSFPPSARKTTSASHIAKYLFTAHVHDLSALIRVIRGKLSVSSMFSAVSPNL